MKPLESLLEKPELFPRDHLEPEAPLTCSQWADKRRTLSRLAGCSEPGQWSTERTPYLREIMDAFSDPEVEEITMKFGTQAGKSEAILNMIGYSIDHDPGPAMVVLPKEENFKSWADNRLKRLILDSPSVNRHATGKEDDLAGKIFQLDNMRIKFAASGSPSDLAESSCRYVFFDETNKYPPFSGREADPLSLGKERQATYWNRKTVKASTPTTTNGVITVEYKKSDQRLFFVPCPLCAAYQVLTFRRNEKEGTGSISWPTGASSEDILKDKLAWYECGTCGGRIEESQRLGMISLGKWVQAGATIDIRGIITGEEKARHRGYHLWAAYSPWRTFSEIAAEFLDSKDDPPKLQNFVNSWLAEEWEDNVEVMSPEALYDRREAYGPELPEGTLLLVAGVDVQDDRFEVEIIAIGNEEESWGIEYEVIAGYPSNPKTWADLDSVLKRTYRNAKGLTFRISGVGLDTGGHYTKEAYSFCNPRWGGHNGPRVFALKGASQVLNDIVSLPSRKNVARVPLYRVDTSRLKKTIYHRLRLDQHGPKYMHFPLSYKLGFFDMLTAEKLKTKFVRGYQKKQWEKEPGRRNEALDIRVYALAALYILNPSFESLAEMINQRTKEIEMGFPEQPFPSPHRRRIISRGIE